jgi:hypothetical protein
VNLLLRLLVQPFELSESARATKVDALIKDKTTKAMIDSNGQATAALISDNANNGSATNGTTGDINNNTTITELPQAPPLLTKRRMLPSLLLLPELPESTPQPASFQEPRVLLTFTCQS